VRAQCFYAGGTHYLIFEKPDESFDLESLAPRGNVCAHGGTLAYRRLRKNILTGQPVVMLYNTGGVTQAFASVHRKLTEGSGMSQGRLPDAQEMLLNMEVVSKENWANNFGMPEVMMMRELAQRAPQLFRKTIVSVDLVNDTAEDVLETLTSCFAGGAGGVPELGLGNAEINVVYIAWKRHLSLYRNAQRFKRWSHAIQYTLYLLGLLTTIASVSYSLIEANYNRINNQNELLETIVLNYPDASKYIDSTKWYKDMRSALRRVVIILPIVSALWTSIRAKLRSRDKWASCLMAAHMITAEIYKFRCRTVEYDTYSATEDGDEDKKKDKKKEEAAVGAKTHEQRTRELFVQRVQNIYSTALSGEVISSGSLSHSGVTRANIEAPIERAAFAVKLQEHIQTNMYALRKRERKEILEEYFEHQGGKDATKATRRAMRQVEPDDLVSPMAVETYVNFRVRPLASRFEQQGPKLNQTQQALEVLVFLFQALGAGLAVITIGTTSLASFVAVSVAVASIFASMLEYHNLQARVQATNNSLRDVHNLITWWGSLSIVDRRTRHSKHHVVSVMERAIISTIAADTNAVESQFSADEDRNNTPLPSGRPA
jgi:ABC-type multidrug transport system fused ATPase/permease subunit